MTFICDKCGHHCDRAVADPEGVLICHACAWEAAVQQATEDEEIQRGMV